MNNNDVVNKNIKLFDSKKTITGHMLNKMSAARCLLLNIEYFNLIAYIPMTLLIIVIKFVIFNHNK